eukprot:1139184-Pelagomonas_calceolata.AAC.11
MAREGFCVQCQIVQCQIVVARLKTSLLSTICAAKNEAATLFGAIRDMGSLLAFWRPVKETLNKGDTKSTNGTPSKDQAQELPF